MNNIQYSKLAKVASHSRHFYLSLILTVSIGITNAYIFKLNDPLVEAKEYNVTTQFEEVIVQEEVKEDIYPSETTLATTKEIKKDPIKIKAIEYITKINPKISKEEAERLVDIHIKYSKEFEVPVALGLAVNKKESTFKPEQISYTGCCFGQMQVNFNIWKNDLKISSARMLFNDEIGIKSGYYILRHYLDKTNGNIHNALKRYYGSTKNSMNHEYALSVMSIYHKFM